MRVKGINSATDIDTAIATVNRRMYGGNVELFDAVKPLGKFHLFRLGVRDSRGSGAAVSGGGRRSRHACWHVWRDVIAALLLENPGAIFRGGLADYDGVQGFLRDYPATGERNIGSMMEPAYASRVCKCGWSGEGPIVNELRAVASVAF
jgi:hypothetical protein